MVQFLEGLVRPCFFLRHTDRNEPSHFIFCALHPVYLVRLGKSGLLFYPSFHCTCHMSFSFAAKSVSWLFAVAPMVTHGSSRGALVSHGFSFLLYAIFRLEYRETLQVN